MTFSWLDEHLRPVIAHLFLCYRGRVLEFNDGFVERLLHLLHLLSIP